MRLRIAVVLGFVVAVWAAWGVFVYRPAANALPACSPNGPLACSTIDGFPTGRLIQDCGGQPDVCGDKEQLAVDGLNGTYGGQQTVVHISEFGLDMARFCGPVLCALSGAYNIFVFEFGDGSRHAIAVSCPGVGPTCKAVQTYTPGSGG